MSAEELRIRTLAAASPPAPVFGVPGVVPPEVPVPVVPVPVVLPVSVPVFGTPGEVPVECIVPVVLLGMTAPLSLPPLLLGGMTVLPEPELPPPLVDGGGYVVCADATEVISAAIARAPIAV
jgi:hypothetical protein